jgi:MerR family redox-sensitive transcriptional activator SoxR
LVIMVSLLWIRLTVQLQVHLKSRGNLEDLLTIGQLAERAGVATSALRFYEDEGLISSSRTTGNQRRYHRATLRRVALIRAAQRVGVPLREVAAALEGLPTGRTPSTKDWERLSERWRQRLEGQITSLEQLRDDLSGCIGCGCLSLETCSLLNPGDKAANLGSGPRYLLGDSSKKVM